MFTCISLAPVFSAPFPPPLSALAPPPPPLAISPPPPASGNILYRANYLPDSDASLCAFGGGGEAAQYRHRSGVAALIFRDSDQLCSRINRAQNLILGTQLSQRMRTGPQGAQSSFFPARGRGPTGSERRHKPMPDCCFCAFYDILPCFLLLFF